MKTIDEMPNGDSAAAILYGEKLKEAHVLISDLSRELAHANFKLQIIALAVGGKLNITQDTKGVEISDDKFHVEEERTAGAGMI